MENKILITGGAGYVGAHVNKFLTQQGYKTVVVDDLARGSRDFLRWGEFIYGNIGDRTKLKSIFSRHRFSAVLHLAGYASVSESVEKPLEYWRNNVLSTLILLDACLEHRVDKFIFSSSCATYGEPEIIPISENCPQHPTTPYGVGKLAVENILDDYSNAYEFRYIVLRFFNAAGADVDAEIGENDFLNTRLIPAVLDTALGRHSSFIINGNNYSTADGTCVRDFIHVTDLAKAFACSLSYLEKGGGSNAFNLGNGHGYSIREVIASAQRVTGRNISVKEAPRRVGDPPTLIASSDAAKNILNWDPYYTELDTIIRTAWGWHKKIYQ